MLKESIDKDGFVVVHIGKRTISKHRYLYQQYYDCNLTSNEVVIFLDGNKRNFEISNLERITRGELQTLNRWYKISSNPEETKAYIALVRLKQKRVELAQKAGLTNSSGQIRADRKETEKKYQKTHREQINAYMREYRRKKKLI